MQDDTHIDSQEDELTSDASAEDKVEAAPSAGPSEDDAIEDAESEQLQSEAEQRAAELSEEEKEARIAMLKPIVEGALMASGEALKLTKIQALFDEHEMPSKGLLLETLALIQEACDGRGFELLEVASGWRFQVREDYAPWVNRLWEERPQKYSRALLETLALIAYRQPITRGDIEEVRGVAVSSHIMKTLTEREWVKVVGHRDVPGRPALYATTRQFLDYFNMKSLDELPTLGELKDIDSLNESLQLDEPLVEPTVEPTAEPTVESEQESESSEAPTESANEIDSSTSTEEEPDDSDLVEGENDLAQNVEQDEGNESEDYDENEYNESVDAELQDDISQGQISEESGEDNESSEDLAAYSSSGSSLFEEDDASDLEKNEG